MRWILANLLLPLGIAAAQRPPALTRQIEFYNPRWSPDGRYILFESSLGGKLGVYVIRPDGSGLAPLAVDQFNNEQPAWSPDGKRVVFSSDREGHLDLYVMNADGTSRTRLTTTPGGGVYGASFSPDGKWILFQGRPDNTLTSDRIHVVGVDGSGLRQLSDTTYAGESPSWSANGTRVTFDQVRYPKRLWSQMQPSDLAEANRTRRHVSMGRDGTGLRAETAPLPRPQSIVAATGTSNLELSPDRGRYVYEKTVDGWAGLWRYDVAAKREQIVIGGPGAGPVGYIRTATLTARVDTLNTYVSAAGSPATTADKAFIVLTVRRSGANRWDVSSDWTDSTGSKLETRQTTRTRRGSSAIEMEMVRAPTDSAAMLITADRVTGWVVPSGATPRLFDGPATEERYPMVAILAGIAHANPVSGQAFLVPSYSLYGSDPLATRIDTLRVLRRDTVSSGGAPVEAIVVQRGAGRIWIEPSTGRELASRGGAGPNRWWWHILRGIEPPRRPD